MRSDQRPYDVRLKDIPIGACYELAERPGAIFRKKFEPGSGPECQDPVAAAFGRLLFGDSAMESEWVFDPEYSADPGLTCSNRRPGDAHERCRLHFET